MGLLPCQQHAFHPGHFTQLPNTSRSQHLSHDVHPMHAGKEFPLVRFWTRRSLKKAYTTLIILTFLARLLYACLVVTLFSQEHIAILILYIVFPTVQHQNILVHLGQSLLVVRNGLVKVSRRLLHVAFCLVSG